MKLKENATLREKKNFVVLKEQTKTMKARDVYTWQDLQKYELQQMSLEQNKTKLQEKT